MAGRSVQELLRTACLFDCRPWAGSASDVSGSGHVPTWVGATDPIFRREVGQVVGLDFRPTNGLDYTVSLGSPTNYAIEIVGMLRTGGAGNATVLYPGAGTELSSLVAVNNRLSFFAGSTLHSSTFFYSFGFPFHAIISVLGTTGTWYKHGAFDATGAVGAAKPSTFTLGNTGAGGGNGMHGLIYQCRIFNVALDADEAFRLYEFSRVQLWPGAPKRSGIVSRMV